MRGLGPQLLRFAASGAVNTALSYAVYLLLLPFLHYLVAYAIAYVAGIASSYVLMTTFVFRAPRRWSTAMRFPFIYVAQYLLGSGITYLLVEHAGVRPFAAALLAMVVVVPTTFVLARTLFRQQS